MGYECAARAPEVANPPPRICWNSSLWLQRMSRDLVGCAELDDFFGDLRVEDRDCARAEPHCPALRPKLTICRVECSELSVSDSSGVPSRSRLEKCIFQILDC